MTIIDSVLYEMRAHADSPILPGISFSRHTKISSDIPDNTANCTTPAPSFSRIAREAALRIDTSTSSSQNHNCAVSVQDICHGNMRGENNNIYCILLTSGYTFTLLIVCIYVSLL